MTVALLALVAGAAGCEFHARSPEQYRDDTQKLLATKSSELQACYDAALKQNKTLGGTVTVKFVVKEETGELTKVALDPAGTTAVAPLTDCVLTALNGLKLNPPDAREGQASFAFDFQSKTVGSAK